MVRMTFVGARRVGLFVWLTLLVSGCASILGNDYEMEQDDAAVGTGASGSRTATSTGGAGGTGGSQAASGAAGSLAGGASGGGGSDVTAGASGAGGAITGGASGATGTGGGAGLDPDAGDSTVTPPDSSVADAGSTDAPSDRSQGGDGPIGSDAADVARFDASDAGGAVDAPVCNPLNGSCGGGGLTCNAGFASCNGNVSDGCECATSGCCGASCQIQHVTCMLLGNPATPCTDGTGQYFYDCVSQGTINGAQATKACTAGTGASSCTTYTCTGAGSPQVLCGYDGVGNCVCWQFTGTNAGRVFKSTSSTCFCPGSAAPTWN
jgi:hypothetical protein